ncbi:hypothetical protein J4G02_21035 [Candidatus Poribacteria bacterium]|nr:hypothetical protein [Candidatus Poribacteria bacterium]
MKTILEKLSAYNIFSYLLPGLLFVILGERLTSFSLIQRSWIVGIVLYYFIMRRLLTLRHISWQKYQAYRNSLLEKYQDSSSRTGGGAPYHYRLLNASGKHFARTAFAAYYEEKITLADLSDAFAKCDPKHLFEIESIIFA